MIFPRPDIDSCKFDFQRVDMPFRKYQTCARLVISFIEAIFCKKIWGSKRSRRDLHNGLLCRSQSPIVFSNIVGKICDKFWASILPNLHNFIRIQNAPWLNQNSKSVTSLHLSIFSWSRSPCTWLQVLVFVDKAENGPFKVVPCWVA